MSDEQPPAPSESLETVEEHAAAEGAEAESVGGIGSREGLQNALFATDPNIPLEQVEDPWHPEQGGFSRIYRGIMKAANVEGLPAILDLGIGIVEVAKGFEVEGEAEQEQEDQAADPNDPII